MLKILWFPSHRFKKKCSLRRKLAMVHKVIKWCSKDPDPEFYIPKPELLPHTRHLSLVLSLLKQFFSEILSTTSIYFLVIQNHAKHTQNYASVNIRGFFCLPCFSHQMASAQGASYQRVSHSNEAVFQQTC